MFGAVVLKFRAGLGTKRVHIWSLLTQLIASVRCPHHPQLTWDDAEAPKAHERAFLAWIQGEAIARCVCAASGLARQDLVDEILAQTILPTTRMLLAHEEKILAVIAD